MTGRQPRKKAHILMFTKSVTVAYQETGQYVLPSYPVLQKKEALPFTGRRPYVCMYIIYVIKLHIYIF